MCVTNGEVPESAAARLLLPPIKATWQYQRVNWKGLSQKSGERVRVGQRLLAVHRFRDGVLSKLV